MDSLIGQGCWRGKRGQGKFQIREIRLAEDEDGEGPAGAERHLEAARSLVSTGRGWQISGMLIDSHTHLDGFSRRGQLGAILGRAEAAGVTRMVTVGTAPDDWALYRELAAAHPGRVFHTVGLHPTSVGEDWEAAVAELPGHWKDARPPVALGEIGLDRFHLPKDQVAAAPVVARQEAALAAQLALARELNCPVIIHSREAVPQCIEAIDRAGCDWRRVVFHCFTEGPALAEAIVSRGGRVSFTGVLTYKNAAAVREAARVQGLERLMLETDAPYLAPVPHRGKPNEPAYLWHLAEFAAGLFGCGVERVAEATTRAAAEFYGLPAEAS